MAPDRHAWKTRAVGILGATVALALAVAWVLGAWAGRRRKG